MRTIAVINGKGGCGKSTIATALAAECQRREVRTLIVDCDAPQYTALRWSKSGRGDVAAVAVADVADVTELGAAFDLVVIDTAGRDDGTMRAALMIADLALVPVLPTPADMWAATDVIRVIQRAQTLRAELEAAIVASRVDSRTKFSRALRGALANTLPVLRTEIHQRNDYAAAMATGEGPTTFAPDGKAAAEIRSLYEEVHSAQATSARAHAL